jgi:protein SCO1/2
MANSMSINAKAFKSDENVMILSHSVTRDKNSVSVLAEYGKNKQIDYKQWKLLTGKKNEIYNLGRNYYFVDENLGERKSEVDFPNDPPSNGENPPLRNNKMKEN